MLWTLTLAIAAEVADIDLLYGLANPITGFRHHHGWTHSIVAVPLMSVLSLLPACGYHQIVQNTRRGRSYAPPRRPLPLSWSLLFSYACLAALTHVILDLATAYGVRLFEPFSFKWYSWDIVYLVDPLLSALLILTLLVPTFLRIIPIKAGIFSPMWARGAAAFAVLGMVFILGFRDIQHRHALAQLNARVYQGEPPVRSSAYPYPWSPFVWKGVIETRDFFATMQAYTFHDGVAVDDMRIYYKKRDTDVIAAAKNTQLGLAYLDWAKYPIAEMQTDPPGMPAYRVWFYDLRSIRRVYGLVELDKNLHVLSQALVRESTLIWVLEQFKDRAIKFILPLRCSRSGVHLTAEGESCKSKTFPLRNEASLNFTWFPHPLCGVGRPVKRLEINAQGPPLTALPYPNSGVCLPDLFLERPTTS